MPTPAGVLSSGVVAQWTPAQLPGVALWLDASNLSSLPTTSPVPQWSDVSGNARHYTAAGALQPVIEATGLNGKPCVRFDGTTMMTRTAFVTSTSSFIISGVVQTDAGQPNTIRLWYALGNNNHVGASQCTETTAWYGWVFGGIAWINAVPAKLAYWDVMTVHRDGTNTSCRSKGVQQGGTSATVPNAASGASTIGGDAFGPFTKCRVAELLVVDGTWTTANRDSLEAYLKAKWGL